MLEAKEFYDLHFEEYVDVVTVGGYVFGRLGRLSVVGDEIEIANGQVVHVEDFDGRRVTRVRVLPAKSESAFEGALSGSAA